MFVESQGAIRKMVASFSEPVMEQILDSFQHLAAPATNEAVADFINAAMPASVFTGSPAFFETMDLVLAEAQRLPDVTARGTEVGVATPATGAELHPIASSDDIPLVLGLYPVIQEAVAGRYTEMTIEMLLLVSLWFAIMLVRDLRARGLRLETTSGET